MLGTRLPLPSFVTTDTREPCTGDTRSAPLNGWKSNPRRGSSWPVARMTTSSAISSAPGGTLLNGLGLLHRPAISLMVTPESSVGILHPHDEDAADVGG